MNFQDTIEAFRRGTFDVNFIAMTWTQIKTGEAEQLCGPGSAVQTPAGQIDVKCHAIASKHTSPFAALERDMSRQSGELYEDEDHYSLRSHRRQRINVARFTLAPHPQPMSIGERAGVIFARGAKLRREQSIRPGAHELTLIFFEQDHAEWGALAFAEQKIVLSSGLVGGAIDTLDLRALRRSQFAPVHVLLL
jgi:hypothetical protein